MPVQTGQDNDNEYLLEFLRRMKVVKDFQKGDVIQDTEVIGHPGNKYGHPKGGGFRVVNYFILSLIESCGGMNRTIWTFWAIDVATHQVKRVSFTELRMHLVV